MKLAFLGAGAMGARMAAKLLDAGHAVTVWNRTPERAAALVKAGATLADTPRAAVQDADAAISMVRDDAASEAVWLDQRTGALAGMPSAAIGVECSTLSLPYVSHLAATFADKGAAFLDAPLAGSRPQAEAGQLIFFVGGLEQHLAAAQPLFEQMGAAAHHAGPTGSGSMVKLAVNALFGAQVALLAEMIGVAERFSGDARRAVEIISSTPVASPCRTSRRSSNDGGGLRPCVSY